MDTIRVTHPRQLSLLRGQKACHATLQFAFSEAYLRQLAALLKSKHAYQLILKESEEFVGYLACAETLWKDHLTIIEIFVSPAYQGKGIGNMFVSQAIEFAQQEGLEGIIVQTERDNLPAQKLYEGSGFWEFENPEWEGLSYKLSFKSSSQLHQH